ncbi:MAG TPA: VCBS repeat-containing protein, partial [Chryseosolibacter sp.]
MNLENGYHHQFSRNVLQLNNGDGTFSEISRYAGVHATDWSWGALIFDMDNDGLKDIFVANGIYKDLLDQDYVNFIGNPEMVREILRKERRVMKRLVDSIPSNPIQNYLFKNNGDLTFSNVAQSSGLDHATFSNGSAYADLDNDGDLDLVLSNVNMPSFVYENRSNILAPNSKSITVQLEGQGRNTSGIGSKITVFAGSQRYYQEINPMRGFMSSIDTRALFGVGNVSKIDSLVVEWPDDRKSVLKDVAVAQVVKVRQSESVKSPKATLEQERKSLFKKLNTGIGFLHRENPYVDFDRDPLLFTMSSNEGPCLCVGDINNDRLDDFYVGGAKGQAGSLFIQQRAGTFTKVSQEVFDGDKESEDTDCVIFDADNDGQNDLYVASGGTEFSSSSPALASRLYFNRGKGRFQKSSQLLPIVERFESTSTVSAADFDNDGDQDLFVGARVVPLLYGVPANGYLLTNDGKGKFRNETASLAPAMKEMGMITASRWIDVNNDRYLDLLVVGDWMGITLFLNRQGKLELQRNTFGDTEGWYRALEVADLNGDGFTDFVTGNHGLNSRFRASKDEPVQLYVNDFDRNGSVEHILTRYSDGKSLPMVLRNDLVKQIPSLRKKYLHYRNYKEQGINDIFSKEQLEHAVILHASDFQSSAWINKKDGTFEKIPLPGLAQITPIYAIAVNDFDGDKIPDILLGGNQTRSKPEAGIYQASYGLLLKGDGNGKFAVLSHQESGVVIHGEMREARAIQLKGEPAIIVARNNDSIEVLIKK